MTAELADSVGPPGESLVEKVRASRLPPPDVRRRIRKEAGLPMRVLAAHLNVTTMTVFRWERGEAVPRMDHAIAYRQLLDELTKAVQ
jgi:DNA-binding transcriptional regulator YiaG